MNGDSFQDWVREYRDRVYNFAFYTLRHSADAEDVTQEVLIRLWHHHRKLEEPTILAWLLKVTKNACYDTLRRHNSRRKRFEEGHDESLVETIADDTPDAQAEIEADDFQKRLKEALSQLPESYREIVVLREIEELKYQEIADITGRPLSSVKIYLHRGRKMLRQQLSREAAEPETTGSKGTGSNITPIEQSPAWSHQSNVPSPQPNHSNVEPPLIEHRRQRTAHA